MTASRLLGDRPNMKLVVVVQPWGKSTSHLSIPKETAGVYLEETADVFQNRAWSSPRGLCVDPVEIFDGRVQFLIHQLDEGGLLTDLFGLDNIRLDWIIIY